MENKIHVPNHQPEVYFLHSGGTALRTASIVMSSHGKFFPAVDRCATNAGGLGRVEVSEHGQRVRRKHEMMRKKNADPLVISY